MSKRGVQDQTKDVDQHFTEIVTAGACLGLWALAWYATTDFPEKAQTYPRFILLCLFAFSTGQLISAVWQKVRGQQGQGEEAAQRRGSAPPTDSDPGAKRSVRPLAFLIIGAVVYLVLLPRAGFVLATTIFLVIGVCISIGWRIRYVVAGTVFVAALYLLMAVLLGIRLPSGVLF